MGRRRELALLEDWLGGEELRVAWVHGLGGIGKSTLLDAYCRAHPELPCVRLHGGAVPSDPDGILAAIQAPLGARTRRLLVVDAIEELAGLETFLRQTLLPRLGAGWRVLVASRRPPGVAWRADVPLSQRTRTLKLGVLSPEASRRLLAAAGVEEPSLAPVVEVTYGHPLLLGLVAGMEDPLAVTEQGLDADPDLARALLHHLVETAPSARHRDALTVMALVRRTDERLLREVLGGEVAPLYQWLAASSGSEADASGLFLQQMVRDIVRTEAKWRDRRAFDALSEAVREVVLARLAELGKAGLRDALFLLSDLPTWSRLGLERNALDPGLVRRETDEDRTFVDATATRQLGAATAAWIARWRDAGAHIAVSHDADGPRAFLVLASLDQLSGALRGDPAVRAAQSFLAAHPSRESAPVVLARAWASAGGNCEDPASNTRLVGVWAAWLYDHPELAYSLSVMPAPDRFSPLLQAWAQRRAVACFATEDDVEWALHVEDFRWRGATGWFRETLLGAPVPAPEQVCILDRDEFGQAVSEALRRLARDKPLQGLRLLSTPAVHRRASGCPERAEAAARELLLEACAAAGREDARIPDVLHHTYVDPAPKQRAAAYELGLGFSTYRRLLALGVEEIKEWLWRAELEG